MKQTKIWELITVKIVSGCLSIIAGVVLFTNNPMELPMALRIIIIFIAMIVVFLAVFYFAMISRFLFRNPKKYTEA